MTTVKILEFITHVFLSRVLGSHEKSNFKLQLLSFLESKVFFFLSEFKYVLNMD